MAHPKGGAMQNRTRRLWGQEFDLLKDGLDEEQVVEFVNQLMVKYRSLVERQEHFLSLGALSEKAAIEADKLAVEVKSRARQEAEVGANKTVAQANQRAQETLASARKIAQEVMRSETESHLEAAHRKADVIGTEAMQKAQLFLIRAKAAIEGDLKNQFGEIYDQLLASLREVLGEGHDVEARWKGKLVELWKREALELGAYEPIPSVLATEMTRASAIAGGESEAKAETPHPEVIAREDVYFEAAVKEEVLDQPPPAAPPAGQRPPGAAAEKPSAEVVVEPPLAAAEEPSGEAVVEEPPRDKMAKARPSKDVETTEEERPRERMATESPAGKAKPETAPPPPKAEPKLPVAYLGELEGEVDISLVAPVELPVMSKIYAQLQGNPEVKVLRTVGSYDKGTTITILLEKPTRLVDMLTGIQGVEVSSETPVKQGFLQRAIGGQDAPSDRIIIPLKTQA